MVDSQEFILASLIENDHCMVCLKRIITRDNPADLLKIQIQINVSASTWTQIK